MNFRADKWDHGNIARSLPDHNRCFHLRRHDIGQHRAGFCLQPNRCHRLRPKRPDCDHLLWPTAGNINIAVCSSSNNSGSITPGAMNVNRYHVFR